MAFAVGADDARFAGCFVGDGDFRARDDRAFFVVDGAGNAARRLALRQRQAVADDQQTNCCDKCPDLFRHVSLPSRCELMPRLSDSPDCLTQMLCFE